MYLQQQAGGKPKTWRVLRYLFVCGAIGALAAVLSLALFALLILKSGSFSAWQLPGIYVSLFIGGLLAGFSAARGLGKSGLSAGMAAGAFCLGLLFVLALFCTGESGTASFVMPGLLCLAGGVAGGIAGVNLGK